jgi:hypothetical protein
VRGGSFVGLGDDNLRCDYDDGSARDHVDDRVGFRCCAP